MKKIDHNIFLAALEAFCSPERDTKFTCLLVDSVSGGRYGQSEASIFYQNLFEINESSSSTSTFEGKFDSLENRLAEPEELEEIRKMALAFAYEVVRFANAKKRPT